MGTWGGLFQYQAGTFARVVGPPEIGLAVLALFEDREGGLWIGTPRGPVLLKEGKFTAYRLGESEGDVDIRAFAEDSGGGLWVGTIGQGLFRLKAGQGNRFEPVAGFPSLKARSLFCDPDGVMWIGSDGAGLFRHKEGSFQAYTSSDGLPWDTVSSIISDAEGNLWMGSDNGMFSCSRKKLVEYEPGHGSDLMVLRLSVDDGLSSRGCSGQRPAGFLEVRRWEAVVPEYARAGGI